MCTARLSWIEPWQPLPPVEHALDDPNGLLAAGRDLSAQRLRHAYERGIFPWYSDGQPVLWWSPDPRMVLPVSAFRATRSLLKTARRVRREGLWRLTLDQGFERVMRACAAHRAGQAGTWITDDIIAAYTALHHEGCAHSVEVWSNEGQTCAGTASNGGESPQLIGGLYGVSIGRMFFGESMFALRPDASKLALFALVRLLDRLGFRVIDCQQATRHLASLGAVEIPRVTFLSDVRELTQQAAPDWRSLSIELPET